MNPFQLFGMCGSGISEKVNVIRDTCVTFSMKTIALPLSSYTGKHSSDCQAPNRRQLLATCIRFAVCNRCQRRE